jgi:hypothetical protein
MEQAYAAIGRAVIAAQLFETAFIPIFEAFKMDTSREYLEETGGFILEGRFKQAIRNVIKELKRKEAISADLEVRLNTYLEDRHLLIHRWIQGNGWPAEGDAVGFAPIVNLANRVQSEATELAQIFIAYLLKFASPDGAERGKGLARIFQDAHLG